VIRRVKAQHAQQGGQLAHIHVHNEPQPAQGCRAKKAGLKGVHRGSVWLDLDGLARGDDVPEVRGTVLDPELADLGVGRPAGLDEVLDGCPPLQPDPDQPVVLVRGEKML
jgi:hypothetical protein